MRCQLNKKLRENTTLEIEEIEQAEKVDADEKLSKKRKF